MRCDDLGSTSRLDYRLRWLSAYYGLEATAYLASANALWQKLDDSSAMSLLYVTDLQAAQGLQG
jgi:hypothetical protein